MKKRLIKLGRVSKETKGAQDGGFELPGNRKP